MTDYLIPGYSLSARSDAFEWVNGLLTPEPWMRDGLCRQTDPDLFFPEKENQYQAQQRMRDAKKVCADCPVRARCLEYAIRNDERFGVWGGLSERERARILNGTTTREGVRK